jgi:hypothetical protein
MLLQWNLQLLLLKLLVQTQLAHMLVSVKLPNTIPAVKAVQGCPLVRGVVTLLTAAAAGVSWLVMLMAAALGRVRGSALASSLIQLQRQRWAHNPPAQGLAVPAVTAPAVTAAVAQRASRPRRNPPLTQLAAAAAAAMRQAATAAASQVAVMRATSRTMRSLGLSLLLQWQQNQTWPA